VPAEARQARAAYIYTGAAPQKPVCATCSLLVLASTLH
jgi:hypothetical protein